MFRGSILPDTISAADDSGQIISWCVRSCICCPLSWWWSYFRIQMDNFMWLHFADGNQNIFTVTKHYLHLHNYQHNINISSTHYFTQYLQKLQISKHYVYSFTWLQSADGWADPQPENIYDCQVNIYFTTSRYTIFYILCFTFLFYNRNSACIRSTHTSVILFHSFSMLQILYFILDLCSNNCNKSIKRKHPSCKCSI